MKRFFSDLAVKYARAFFAVTHGEIHDEAISNLERAHQEMERTHRAWQYVRIMQKNSGALVVIENFLKQFSVDVLLMRLVRVLDEEGRLFLLHDVIGALVRTYRQKKGLLRAHVTSASSLSLKQQHDIECFIQRNFKEKISKISYQCDKRLIAGIRIRVDSWQWEHSVSQQLQLLHQRLMGVCNGH